MLEEEFHRLTWISMVGLTLLNLPTFMFLGIVFSFSLSQSFTLISQWLVSYVLSFIFSLQEIVPLNAGNIFGIEDDQPASVWENIIRDALNRVRPRKGKILSHSDPPSPSMFKSYKEVSHDMFLETRHAFSSGERPILSEEDSITNIEALDSTNDNASTSTPDRNSSDSQREERSGYNERVCLSWPEPPLKLLNQYVLERRGAFKSLNLSIMNLRKPEYVRIVSKQMVGVFITVWVRSSLRKHISNLSVSTVGVGIMGYIGNKVLISLNNLFPRIAIT